MRWLPTSLVKGDSDNLARASEIRTIASNCLDVHTNGVHMSMGG